MEVRKRKRLLACGVGPVVALALLPRPAGASGVDGAGETVVVPLAFTGSPRESTFTITNPNPETVRVQSTYVGAEGTVNAASVRGTIPCDDQDVPGRGSVTLLLRTLCPAAYTADAENFGYVSVSVDVPPASSPSEPIRPVFVSTIVSANGVSTGVDGQPIGDHDPGFSAPSTLGLQVAGLRTRQNQRERPVCFVGTFGELKKVSLNVLDSSGNPLASGLTRTLDPERMEAIDLQSALGLPLVDQDDLRLVATSGEPGLLLLGCGGENRDTKSIAYQPSQTPEPSDRSRLHSVTVHAELVAGPYHIAYVWWHTPWDPEDRKVQLSTYLRPDDEVRCVLENWVGDPYGTIWPHLELRVLDPAFNVIAGGSNVQDTGLFRTASRGKLSPAAGDRHVIEISYNEGSSWPHWPQHVPHTGTWQVRCMSAAGMSEPISVPSAALDDF
jgi:hypothetical protein